MNRRTKIIATMGPAIRDLNVLKQVLKAGVNVVRFNFSHGDHEQHAENVKLVRQASHEINKTVGILADLQGPEIRTDTQTYEITKGQTVILRAGKGSPEKNVIGISHNRLYSIVSKKAQILADDGYLGFTVKEVKDKDIVCQVNVTGVLKPRKSMNLPDVDIQLPILSKKDKADLDFIANNGGFDWVAASFVNTPADVSAIRFYMKKVKLDVPLISKIESTRSTHHLDEIISASDGIMVARGDLGVELPPEQVPILQNIMIKKAKEHGKVIIIATQMLESMTNNPRPSRPETTDVSNAAKEKVDALMLSGETATGKYPVQTVQMMDKIIMATQPIQDQRIMDIHHKDSISDVCKASLYLSLFSNAKCVITVSIHGKSPRILSSHRANKPVIVACTSQRILRRSCLYYSVNSFLIDKEENPNKIFSSIETILKTDKLVKKGDKIIFLYPYPSVTKHGTNSIRQWVIE